MDDNQNYTIKVDNPCHGRYRYGYNRPREARGTVMSSNPEYPQLAPVFWSRWATFCPTLLLLLKAHVCLL